MSQNKITIILGELQEELSKTKTANNLVSESKIASDIIEKSDKLMNQLIKRTDESANNAMKEAKKIKCKF